MKINLTSRLLDEISISKNVSQKFEGEPFWELYYRGEAKALEFVLGLILNKAYNPESAIEERKLQYVRIDDRARSTCRQEHPAARIAAGWLSGLSIAEHIMRVWEGAKWLEEGERK